MRPYAVVPLQEFILERNF